MAGKDITPTLQGIGTIIDDTLMQDMDVPTGFVLIVFVEGNPQFVSNCPTDQVMKALRYIGERQDMHPTTSTPIPNRSKH